jgi:hypothetical protein
MNSNCSSLIQRIKKCEYCYTKYYGLYSQLSYSFPLPSIFTFISTPTDPSFNPGDSGFAYGDGANDDVYATAIQSDGKIIIGGIFTSYNGVTKNRKSI